MEKNVQQQKIYIYIHFVSKFFVMILTTRGLTICAKILFVIKLIEMSVELFLNEVAQEKVSLKKIETRIRGLFSQSDSEIKLLTPVQAVMRSNLALNVGTCLSVWAVSCLINCSAGYNTLDV